MESRPLGGEWYGAGQAGINEHTLPGAVLEAWLSDLMDELRELDEDKKAFQLLNRPLLDGCTQARKIISSGSGGSKEKQVAAKVSSGLEMETPASVWRAGGFLSFKFRRA